MANHFGQVIPADAGHSETPTIYGAVITVTILATIAVIFRFVARRKSEAPISYEYVVPESRVPHSDQTFSLGICIMTLFSKHDMQY